MPQLLALETLQLAVTAIMFGVIWIVQILHYPLLVAIEKAQFPKWHHFHSNRISFIAGPLMCAELGLALLIAFLSPTTTAIGVTALTVGIWASTFFVSVPLHNRLQVSGYDAVILSRLTQTNWPRTAMYSLKLGLVLGSLLLRGL